jgi:hypothetical protein
LIPGREPVSEPYPEVTMKAFVTLFLVPLVAIGVLFNSAACDSGGADAQIPTQQELIGTWVNDDAGTTRAFEFVASVDAGESPALAARSFVYTLYFHPTGPAPQVAQRGFYTITEGHLVTEVVEAPLDPSQVGRSFANIIKGFSESRLVLESTSSASGTRTFARAEAN